MSIDAETLAEFINILDERDSVRRRAELNQQRWKKLVVARQVGQTQIQCEMVVEEDATAQRIYDVVAPIDGAIDRLKAKSDLSDHYFRMLNKCGEIEMSAKKHASETYAYGVRNRAHNAGRRIEVGLTDQQRQNLQQIETTIATHFEQIEEMKAAAAECRRVLDGENPFEVLEQQLEKRLSELRPFRRPDAA